jgi:protein-S-isoprenylcysteine O-methyltransferase Ste14
VTDDDVFRYIIIAASAAVFPIGLYHRIRSQSSREPLDRRKEGLFILFTLRPIAAIGAIGGIAYLIDPAWMAWSQLPLPLWLRWTGIPIGFAAAALLIWTMTSIGLNLTDTVVTRKVHALVAHGPYRWIRHPLYVAALMTVVGFSLASANWFVLVMGVLAFSLLVVRVKTEEALLVARFGEEYRAYMARTNRFWPAGSKDPASNPRSALRS